MSLFSQSQMEQINKVVVKAQDDVLKSKPVSAKSIGNDLAQMSQAVLEYFKDSPAILITTEEQLHDYVDKCIEYGYAGIDTETTGLDRVRDHVVGASLYVPGMPECYIPMKHVVPIFEQPYKNQLSYEQVKKEFDRLRDCKLIFANADYDLAMIWKDIKTDFNDACYYDVIIAWRCLKEDELKNDLKSLYIKYVLRGQGDPKKFTDFFSPKLFPYCKPEVAKLYAANDAKITFDLFKWQLPYLTPSHPKCQKGHFEKIAALVWNIEFPMIKVCQNMFRRGMYLDKYTGEVLNERYGEQQAKELKKLQNMVQEIIDANAYKVPAGKKRPFTTGDGFNPESPVHVKYLLYDLMQLPKVDGQGTGKEVLHDLNLPVTNQILKVRSLGVLINTFVKKMPRATTPDSRIHGQFKQIGAACITGDSIIPTADGYYTIEELCGIPADMPDGEFKEVSDVSIINKDQKFELASHCVRYRDVETVKITTELGLVLEGTPNHPVMVSKYNAEDKSKYLMYYYKGDYPRLHKMWEDRRFKRLDELSVGDIIEIPCNYTTSGKYQPTNLHLVPSYKSKFEDVTIPEVYTEEFAEFLGMYHADGSSGLREGTYTITLSNDDPDVYNRFEELTKNLFNLPISQYTKQRELNEVESYINCIQIKEIDSILCKGTRNKRIPKPIWTSPVSVINAYIRGMTLDSSVHLDENGRVEFEFSIINQEDMRFVQYHLLSQGIYSHVSYNVDGVKDQFLRLCFNADNYIRFRDQIGFVESKKVKETKSCFKNQYCHRRVDDSFYVKVKKIEVSRNDVYDFTVPESHSFISNGMISHNTGRMSSANPNLQNIPSHAVDIRHLFRATPSMHEELECEDIDENTVTIITSRWNSVHLEDDTEKYINDLQVGEIVKTLEARHEILCTVKELTFKLGDATLVLVRKE